MTEMTPQESFTSFKCIQPDFAKGKRVISLARTDRLWAGMQYVREGGENNLHSHNYMDGVYFVVKGRARFYGENDVVLGEVGANEGMVISRGLRYWFESCGEETLELLLVQCFDRSMGTQEEVDDDRVDHIAKKASQLDPTLYAETGMSTKRHE
jgi:mannose-6-phosphate isomerase-like protein (cupin superfamily)